MCVIAVSERSSQEVSASRRAVCGDVAHAPCVHACRYPSLMLPGFLYLGDWGHACDEARLRDIGVRRCMRACTRTRTLAYTRALMPLCDRTAAAIEALGR